MGTTLTIIFVVLKILGVIGFSWLYVFLPMGIELLLTLLWPFITLVWYKIARWATSEDF